MTQGQQHKTSSQLIWGIALILVGIGVFIRIPQVMPKLAGMEQFAGAMGFIRFCFYLMGIILIGGGVKKMIAHTKIQDNLTEEPAGEDELD